MDKHLSIVEDLKQKATEDKNVIGMLLFGSVIKKEHTPYSDIDLLFICNELNYNMSVFRERINGVIIQGYKVKYNYLFHLLLIKEHLTLENFANGELIISKKEELNFIQKIARMRFHKQSHSPDGWYIQTKRDYYSVMLDQLKRHLDDRRFVLLSLRLLTVNILQHHIRINHLWMEKRSHRMKKISEKDEPLYKIVGEFYNSDRIENKIAHFKKMVDFVFHKYGGMVTNDWGMRIYDHLIPALSMKKSQNSPKISQTLKSRTSVVNINEL